MKFDYQDYLKNGAWKRYAVRRFPERSEPWFFFVAFGILALGIIIPYWTGYALSSFVLSIITTICLYALAFPLRCPKCEGKVITRIVNDENRPDEFYHYCHDCPKCEISWETKTKQHSSS